MTASDGLPVGAWSHPCTYRHHRRRADADDAWARAAQAAARLGGRPILQWSVDAFLAMPRVDEWSSRCRPSRVETRRPTCRHERVTLVPGGARRQDSVANGFARLVATRLTSCVIHDAARPLLDACVHRGGDRGRRRRRRGDRGARGSRHDQVVVAEQAADAAGARAVERTLPRERVFLAQTPQAFRREVLRAAVALGQSGVEATDEAALAERAGYACGSSRASARNIKVTTAEDLVIAEALVMRRNDEAARSLPAPRATATLRVGTGYDLHRLADGRPLVLGGVEIPFDRGLVGHSDADALSPRGHRRDARGGGAGDIGHALSRHRRALARRVEHGDARARASDLVRGKRLPRRQRRCDDRRRAPEARPAPRGDRRLASRARSACPRRPVSVKAKTNEGVGRSRARRGARRATRSRCCERDSRCRLTTSH